MMDTKTIIALSLFCACLVFHEKLESDPVTHVLVQLPLLAFTGALIVSRFVIGNGTWNRGGFAALLIALFAFAFWMLPRSIDAVLTSPFVNAAKFVLVPLLIGAPLAIGWRRAHPLLQGFLKAQAISMLGILAFLYTHAPIRICNAYLVSDQERLGYGFLFAALGVSLIWIIPLFKPRNDLTLDHLRMPVIQ